MGPLRKFRIVFWPATASAAVIGLLFVFERESSMPLEIRSPRSASTHQMPRPWTLSDSERKAGPRVAWTGPSLSAEPFSRDELGYPIPATADVAVSMEPQPTAESGPKFGADPPVEVVVNEPLEPDYAAWELELAMAAPKGPSVLVPTENRVDDETNSSHDGPIAALRAPKVNRDELPDDLGDPLASGDPFGSMQLSVNRVDPVPAESPVENASPLQTTSPAIKFPTDSSTQSPIQRTPVGRKPSEWPQTRALNDLIGEIDLAYGGTGPAETVCLEQLRQTLDALQAQPKIATTSSGELLTRLSEIAEQAYEIAEGRDDLPSQRKWFAVAYAVQRRAELWSAIYRNLHEEPTARWESEEVASERISLIVDRIEKQIIETGDEAGWSEFLLLPEIRAASEGNVTDARRRLIAQQYISRVQFAQMTDIQREWLEQSDCLRLDAAIRSWAYGPVDYVALMEQIEIQELDPVDRDGGRIAATMQTLRFANNEHAYAIARAINRHYRNANLRLSVSETMLDRLLPQVPEKSQPIRDKFLGASILGTSHARTQLDVKLQPAPDAWQVLFASRGTIDSRTQSHRGPARLNHVGSANFEAGARVRIDREGVQVSDPQVEVDSSNRLQRLRTQYDGFPVVGPLFREYVLQRQRETRAAARRYSEGKMRDQIEKQMSESLRKQIDEAQQTFESRLLGPLANLQLRPTVVDLATTKNRLNVRYRLSGDWQLAAFTPRPRAPRASLMSIQLHQSTLNNALERLAPRGREVPIVDAIEHLMQVFAFDQSASDATEDVPQEVMIQFTTSRPMTVEIVEGQLELTLRIVRLSRTEGAGLRNFIVKAIYVPHIDGIKPTLVRDGHLNISGPRMTLSDRVAVRAIFNKVLSPNRPLQLTSEKLQTHPAMEGLAITQLELRDGWIGLAIGDEAHYMAEAALYTLPERR